MAAVKRRSAVVATSLALAASLIALAGCDDGDTPLDGTHWRLTAWTLSSLNTADFTITARFGDGQISGSSGVNTYFGPYSVDSGGGFAIGPLTSTEIAGPAPAMRAERAYMTLLGQARSYELGNGRFTLFDQGGNESLIFEAAGS